MAAGAGQPVAVAAAAVVGAVVTGAASGVEKELASRVTVDDSALSADQDHDPWRCQPPVGVAPAPVTVSVRVTMSVSVT